MFRHTTDNVHFQVPQKVYSIGPFGADHSNLSLAGHNSKSLIDVRDPLANLGHECNYAPFRPILRDVKPSTSTPLDYRHAFWMTREMVLGCVVNIQLLVVVQTLVLLVLHIARH